MKGDEIEGGAGTIEDEGVGDKLQALAGFNSEHFLHSNFVLFLLWVKAGEMSFLLCKTLLTTILSLIVPFKAMKWMVVNSS